MKSTIVSQRIAVHSTHSLTTGGTASVINEDERQQYQSNNYSKNVTISSTSTLVKVSLLLLMIFSASKLSEAKDIRSVRSDGSPLQLFQFKRSRTQVEDLPECSDEKSVCGYVQLNSMGISSQPICKCKGLVQCPLMWNPLDGRTVSHGNDQYKYCNRAPTLKYCSKDDIVYTTYLETSMITFDVLLNTNHIHCLCSAHHLFIRNSTKFHDLEDGTSIIGTTHLCKPPPVCRLTDTCMAITQSAHSSFITRNCVCPFGTFCPNDIRLASQRMDMNRGSYYMMSCI